VLFHCQSVRDRLYNKFWETLSNNDGRGWSQPLRTWNHPNQDQHIMIIIIRLGPIMKPTRVVIFFKNFSIQRRLPLTEALFQQLFVYLGIIHGTRQINLCIEKKNPLTDILRINLCIKKKSSRQISCGISRKPKICTR